MSLRLVIESQPILQKERPQGPSKPTAEDLVRQSGVKGGLIVHVGCGNAKWTAALRINGRYVVQGLETNPSRVTEARENLRDMGVSGGVSVLSWTGKRLPYVDNLVNLVVAEDLACVMP